MPTHTINGHEIHFERHGQGEPLLLLHSFLCNTKMWDCQIETLAANHTVIVMDIRGHGKSSPSRPHSMYDLVNDAIKLLDAEGIEKAAWLGLSIGGMVSMRAALTHPERVSKLVLLATDAKAESLLVKIERRLLAQVVKRFGVAPVVIPVLRKMFGKSTFRSRKELIKLWRPRFLEVHTESMLKTLQTLLTRDDVSENLKSVQIPTLIIHGKEDRAIPVSLAHHLSAHMPEAQLVILENSGHLVTLETPERVNQEITNFLS